jgi:hypothetical protein
LESQARGDLKQRARGVRDVYLKLRLRFESFAVSWPTKSLCTLS